MDDRIWYGGERFPRWRDEPVEDRETAIRRLELLLSRWGAGSPMGDDLDGPMRVYLRKLRKGACNSSRDA